MMTWRYPPAKRSVPCNGDIVRHHRNRRGFTQPELADRTGFTTRLVAKAEAGGSLRTNTIEVLAEALSTKRYPVYPEDLVSSPAEIVRQVLAAYDKYQRRCDAHCGHLLADNVSVLVSGASRRGRTAEKRVRADGSTHFWETFFAAMKRSRQPHAGSNMRLFVDGRHVAVLNSRDSVDIAPIALVFEIKRGRVSTLEDHLVTGPEVGAR